MSGRTVALVPSKLNSQRVPRKNVRPVGGRPLVNWVLDTLSRTSVEESVVYAVDDEICRFIEPELPHRFVARPPHLDADEAKVQDFVGAFLADVEVDIVVLLHITSPSQGLMIVSG